MDDTTRRKFLRTGGVAGTVVFTGCLQTIQGESNTATATPDIKDTDGDGVIDSEDYAPRDPEIQRKEQLVEDTPTKTETPTETPPGDGSAVVVDDFENPNRLSWSIDSGDRSRLEFTTESAQGNYSLYFRHSSEDIRTEISRSLRHKQMTRFSFWYKYESSNNNNFRMFLNNSSGDRVIVFQEANEATRYWNPENKGEFIQNSVIAEAKENTWYQIIADKIDFSNYTMNISVYGSDGDLVDKVENAGFWTESNEISEIVIRDALGNNGNPDPLWIDHIMYEI